MIQSIRNASYASKQNKHAGANKQSYIKVRPLRKHSKFVLFFSFSLKSLNSLQHTITLSRLFHTSITLKVKKHFTNIKSKTILV